MGTLVKLARVLMLGRVRPVLSLLAPIGRIAMLLTVVSPALAGRWPASRTDVIARSDDSGTFGASRASQLIPNFTLDQEICICKFVTAYTS
jgi:hypothetical protein